MRITQKIVAMASVGLIAGTGFAISAPASVAAPVAKKTTYSGSAVISLDKSLKPIIKKVVVVPPAKKRGTTLVFPVVGVEGDGILLGGGTQAGSDPVIVTNDDGTGALTISVAGTAVELCSISKWKVRDTSTKGKVTTQRWQGVLYLTDNQLVVDRLNEEAGRKVFTAGQLFGVIRATVKSTKG